MAPLATSMGVAAACSERCSLGARALGLLSTDPEPPQAQPHAGSHPTQGPGARPAASSVSLSVCGVFQMPGPLSPHSITFLLRQAGQCSCSQELSYLVPETLNSKSRIGSIRKPGSRSRNFLHQRKNEASKRVPLL